MIGRTGRMERIWVQLRRDIYPGGGQCWCGLRNVIVVSSLIDKVNDILVEAVAHIHPQPKDSQQTDSHHNTN